MCLACCATHHLTAHLETPQEPVPTVQVNLGDIPGRLVDLGRPPLPSSAKALAAAELSRQEPPQSPKDSTIMEHRLAGDLALGKLNKSMRKSMARSRRRSEGSAKSRKSMANSDLQVSACCSRQTQRKIRCCDQMKSSAFADHLPAEY